MVEPIFKVACPACGAPVSFSSSASVMAVCAYCQSTLLREADSVRDIGKMSAVLPDYSPIQLGTSGLFEGHAFTVVGRLQLQYEDGYWNEWYAVFEEGGDGWLADASGQYVFTRAGPVPAEAPAFTDMHAGLPYHHAGLGWVAADVRAARCIAGVGELPFTVGAGYEVRAADFRMNDRFMTLDWSEPLLRCYLGKAVTLEGMRCQLLRDDSAIADSAGRLPGKIATLACPACGSAMQYVPGLTQFSVCPACHAESRNAPDVAEVLNTHQQMVKRHTTLDLGDSGQIDNLHYDVLGIMVVAEVGSDERWTEYLLFNATHGFLWLVETRNGWQRAQVLDNWPAPAGRGVQFDGAGYEHLYQYVGRVMWAAGSFNWRVKLGDSTTINDYRHGNITLSLEHTPQEMTWSRSLPVSGAQLAAWFSQKPFAQTAAQVEQAAVAEAREGTGLEMTAKVVSALLLIFNVPALFMDGGASTLFLLVVSLLLLWAPIWFYRRT